MDLVAPLMTVLLLGVDDPLATKASSKLFRPIDLTVESKPVGEFLKSFAAEQGVEIVVDGRVDATATVRGRFKKSFVERIFSDAARFANARMVVIGEVVYIAPQESADRVAAAFLKARQSLASNENIDGAAWKEKRSTKWDGEATVQSLVVGLAKELGLTVKNPDDLDVKASAGSLKNVTASNLFSVWTALADQTWVIDESGKTIVISPLPEDARLERRVRASSAAEATRRADGYRALPDTALSVDVNGSSIVLAGPWSALWAAERLDREEALAVAAAKTQKTGKGSKTPAPKRYNPTFKNVTLAQFAETVSGHMKKSVEIDEDSLAKAGKSKDLRLNCVATGVELEEMLSLALEPLDLKFRINGDKIVIYAGK
jgi:type II secretory pathway component GspD/PulD (secretin)